MSVIFVCYSREFVITVIVITEFDYTLYLILFDFVESVQQLENKSYLYSNPMAQLDHKVAKLAA
jgi:hypothetical protein